MKPDVRARTRVKRDAAEPGAVDAAPARSSAKSPHGEALTTRTKTTKSRAPREQRPTLVALDRHLLDRDGRVRPLAAAGTGAGRGRSCGSVSTGVHSPKIV